MSSFPTPTRATTINNLNVISSSELEASVVVKTVVSLADGTPRSFDLKAMQASIERNGERIVENEGRIEQNSAQIEQNHTLQSNEMTSLWMRLAQLENRTLEEWMPVGHIIVQLPSQPEPSVLYPRATWENISASYAGDFFRVEGGRANHFDNGIQEESLPLPNVSMTASSASITPSSVVTGISTRMQIVATHGNGTQNVSLYTGSTKSNLTVNIADIEMAIESGGAYGRREEVAPQNQTIRIWQKMG